MALQAKLGHGNWAASKVGGSCHQGYGERHVRGPLKSIIPDHLEEHKHYKSFADLMLLFLTSNSIFQALPQTYQNVCPSSAVVDLLVKYATCIDPITFGLESGPGILFLFQKSRSPSIHLAVFQKRFINISIISNKLRLCVRYTARIPVLDMTIVPSSRSSIYGRITGILKTSI